jgi:integrase
VSAIKKPGFSVYRKKGRPIFYLSYTDETGRRREVPGDEKRKDTIDLGIRLAARSRMGRLGFRVSDGGLTVGGLLRKFLDHAGRYYRRADGSSAPQLQTVFYCLRDLEPLADKRIDLLRASDFRRRLEDLPAEPRYRPMRNGTKTKLPPLCRREINRRLKVWKQLFKWAQSERMVPSDLANEIRLIDPIPAGRFGARESDPILPVPEQHVENTLPFMSPAVAAMVKLELITGARPDEICRIRGLDIDTTGEIWLYRPGSDTGAFGQHKTAYKKKQRLVPLNADAQDVLHLFLRPNLKAWLFSPREVQEARFAALRAARKTPVQPSQQDRRAKEPKITPGERYTTASYYKAVQWAIKKAIAAGAAVEAWHPNQLRHSAATRLSRSQGPSAAAAVLGHASLNTSQIYIDRNVNDAVAASLKDTKSVSAASALRNTLVHPGVPKHSRTPQKQAKKQRKQGA